MPRPHVRSTHLIGAAGGDVVWQDWWAEEHEDTYGESQAAFFDRLAREAAEKRQRQAAAATPGVGGGSFVHPRPQSRSREEDHDGGTSPKQRDATGGPQGTSASAGRGASAGGSGTRPGSGPQARSARAAWHSTFVQEEASVVEARSQEQEKRWSLFTNAVTNCMSGWIGC